MSPKVTPDHLSRRAVIYVRQSTMDQVKNNVESQRRQYALEDKAREMGWSDIEIIDDDLGKSGASSANRTGFMRLVGQVSLKEIGAVFAVEVSRLARNNKDWAQLVDICGLANTLIIDHDGIYDPHILNDRLLLGLKGTMSEFELGMIRQRSVEAIKQMVQRGELWTIVPAGYVKIKKHGIEKTADKRVQQAIMLVFSKFAELSSVRQVLLWFHREKIELPVLDYDEDGAYVLWKLPVYNTISAILQNPIYAGVYAYGRRKTATKIVGESITKTRSIRSHRKEWQVFIPNHHEEYIPLAVYEQNQRAIEENTIMNGALTRGPARNGSSLLAGLLRCRRCGRKLQVAYSGKAGNVLRYSCQGDRISTIACISFGGFAVDRAVEKEILSVIEPDAIKRALEHQQASEQQRECHLKALEHAVTQAEYEVERAFRQYNKVDPENRLVAGELERRWNEMLQKAADARQKYENYKATQESTDYSYLLTLADDFESVWHNPLADMSLKKRIARALIHEIMVDVDEEKALIDMVIHWAGDCHTTLQVKKNKTGKHRYNTDKQVIEIIRELANVAHDREIASTLNRLGLKTGKNNNWCESYVKHIRYYYGIASYSPAKKEKLGYMNMAEAAQYLEISPMSVRRLIMAEIIPAKQVVPTAPWIILREDLDNVVVRQAVGNVKNNNNSWQTNNPDQMSLDFVEMEGE